MRHNAVLVACLLAACSGALAGRQLRFTLPALPLHQMQASRNPQLGAVAAASNNATSVCGGKAAVCADCNTVQRCFIVGATFQPGNVVKCSGSTPYCLDGACTATVPDSNACASPPVSSSFACPADNVGGYYPDPSDCKKYHFCTGGSAYDDDCLAYSNAVFDLKTAQCIWSYTNDCYDLRKCQCYTFSCPSSLIGVYQKFEGDPSLYYVCKDRDVRNALMAKCPENFEIDASDLSNPVCAASCTRQGRLAVPGSRTRYYECVKISWRSFSSPVLKECPGGSTFDAPTERCVPATSSSTTPAPPPTTTQAPAAANSP